MLSKGVVRRNPFKIGRLPWIVRLYLWATKGGVGTGVKLGIFFLFQRFWPWRLVGKFYLNDEEITYDATNTQFGSLYNPGTEKGYELELMALLDVVMDKKGVLYDVGCNWGYFSVFAASKKNFEGSVYAFEPYPSTFDNLKEVVSQTRNGSKITCLEVGLSNEEGQREMRYQGLLDSGFAYLGSTPAKKSALNVLSPRRHVRMARLDSMNLEPPTIIKIDAQFHEKEVLEGATKTLSTYKPLIVFENCLVFENPEMTWGPLKVLENLGYRLFFPCWTTKYGEIPSEADRGNFTSDRLALVPVSPKDRFLYRDMINILACHESKISDLESKFRS